MLAIHVSATSACSGPLWRRHGGVRRHRSEARLEPGLDGKRRLRALRHAGPGWSAGRPRDLGPARVVPVRRHPGPREPRRADLLQLSTLTLSGPVGVPGAGSATLAIPLTFPVNPAIAGTTYFAQVGIADPTGTTNFSASAGLRITITMPPLVAVTSTTSTFAPAPTTTQFIDPLTMTQPFPAQTIPSDPSTGMAFAHGGRDLFVARSTGNRIDRFDFSGGAPVRSVFHASFGYCVGVAVDHVRDLVYTIVEVGSVAGLVQYLVAVDASGQQVGGNSLPFAGVWGLSVGNLAAVVSRGLSP